MKKVKYLAKFSAEEDGLSDFSNSDFVGTSHFAPFFTYT